MPEMNSEIPHNVLSVNKIKDPFWSSNSIFSRNSSVKVTTIETGLNDSVKGKPLM